MQAITLDQLAVLLAVVEQGSFSGAARTLNRAQSAVTYAVQKLEEQVGVALFDRSAYRPILTEAGIALLPRARRMVEDAAALLAHARGIAGGLESELTMVVDAMFPLPCLLEALRAFSAHYPQVPTRLHIEALGATASLVLDGTCAFGLLPRSFNAADPLALLPLLDVEMVPVAAPCHPLSAYSGPIAVEIMREHVQLVLADRSTVTAGRDFGVLSTRVWRLGDLGVKHAMLVAGLGWGGMPRHMVEADIAQERLRIIQPAGLTPPRIAMCIAHRRDASLGPASRWMIAHLLAGAPP